jgi:hypothetical protein
MVRRFLFCPHTHYSLSTNHHSLPIPSHQTPNFPPTPSIQATSRVSIRMMRCKYYIFTVISFHAIIPHVSLAPSSTNPAAVLLCVASASPPPPRYLFSRLAARPAGPYIVTSPPLHFGPALVPSDGICLTEQREGYILPAFHLATRHSPLATKSFTIRTSANSPRNPFRMRTSKESALKVL